jgi:general secretion pathway protein D
MLLHSLSPQGTLTPQFVLIVLGLATLVGCATPGAMKSADALRSVPAAQNASNLPKTAPQVSVNSQIQANNAIEAAKAAEKLAEPPKRVFPGNGTLVKPPPSRPAPAAGDLKFNFENTDVREVVRSILGDILQENYLVDPAVTGAISMRMTKGIQRSDLIPTLEAILRQANAILVKDGALWRVQPSTAGVRGVGRPSLLARQATAGYGITLVPLKYIGVNEMMRLLDAVVKEPVGQGGAGGSVRPEPLRNMLILAGTPAEQQYILDTVEMFDVDWMAGMSAGLFTLEHSDAKKVLEEVDKVFGGLGQGAPAAAGAPAGGLGPLFGLVRVQLIERLNALLVISPQPHILEQAETWIRRLDRGGSADSTRLYVYNLQYTNAEKLAPILQSAMQGRAGPTTAPVAQTAPGQNPLNIATPVAIPSPTSPNQPAAVPVPARVQPPTPTNGGAGGTGQGTALARNATITADKDRNALLITATPSEYSAIEQAIKKLDLLPRQVMVEVTILEVDLTDEFELGVSWAASKRADGATSPSRWTDSVAGINTSKFPGFGLALANRDIAGNILNLLNATLTANDGNKRARIHASPKLMAVDNTPVTFNVGRSVSVQTSTVTQPGSTAATNSTSNTYQYLQTGISVSITPRISAGGLVNLEITQEISEPTAGAAGNPNPDISKTALKNTVLAQDGETIVMAGLIREKISDSTSGLPGVSRVPLLGSLFGKQGLNVDKQELLVLVRPVVINSIEQARDASDEIRNKMLKIKDAFGDARPDSIGVFGAATPPTSALSKEPSPDAYTRLRVSPDLDLQREGRPN